MCVSGEQVVASVGAWTYTESGLGVLFVQWQWRSRYTGTTHDIQFTRHLVSLLLGRGGSRLFVSPLTHDIDKRWGYVG